MHECNTSKTVNEANKMSKIVTEVEEANKKYAANFGDKGNLALPPARGFAILTCMDARLGHAQYAGLRLFAGWPDTK